MDLLNNCSICLMTFVKKNGHNFASDHMMPVIYKANNDLWLIRVSITVASWGLPVLIYRLVYS